MMTGVKVMTDDVTQLMIPARKALNQLNGINAVSDEVAFRGEEMNSEQNDL